MKVLGNLFLVLAFASSVAARIGRATEDKEKITDQYIVVLNERVSQLTRSGNNDDVMDRANNLVKYANEKARANTNAFERSNVVDSTILEVYDTALKGFTVSNLSEAALKIMLASADVQYIEQDQVVQLDSVQSPTPSWGLGRLDDKIRLNDYSYSYDFIGSSVVAFVIDTGVFISHNDFEGRARFGYDATGEGMYDGHGHGTHVGKFQFDAYYYPTPTNLITRVTNILA
jgi:subtilisin family serine protease